MEAEVSERRFTICRIPKEKYERLNAAVQEMNTPFYNADDFVYRQVEEVLTQYDK